MSAERPNVVFFMLDQLSARWFEAVRSGPLATPNFDRLCERGVSFANAISSNPVCCPTRATIATGMTTRQHGVLQNGYELDPALPTFMKSLQQAGYATAALGKVHLHAHFHGVHPDYRPYGYDEVHNTEDPRGGEWLDWIRDEHPDHLDGALAQIWATGIPEFAAYGPDAEDLRGRIAEARRRHDWTAGGRYPRASWGAAPLSVPRELSQTEWITSHAERFIASVAPDRPLHAHVSYVQPHGPFYAPPDLIDRVDEADLPTPAPAEWTDDPHAPRSISTRPPGERDTMWARRCYFADLLHLDEQLGRVMDALEAAGRADDTYVILLADHGDMLGDHGFWGKEHRHYDACIRVPLVIAGGDIPGGVVRDEIVQLEDICPTVLDAAGLEPPRQPKLGGYLNADPADIPTLGGRSLLPLCRGETPDDWRRDAYSESYNAIWSIDPADWARTLRTHEWRYTWYPCGGGEQLFRISEDPDEQHNRVADDACADVRHDLRDRLMERIVLQDHPHTLRDLFAQGVH